jgi:hypothetical protein
MDIVGINLLSLDSAQDSSDITDDNDKLFSTTIN